MNTRRLSCHLRIRRWKLARAAITSGRFCSDARIVFFSSDAHALELAPHRGFADRDAGFVLEYLAQDVQCCVRVLAHELGQALLGRTLHMPLSPRRSTGSKRAGPQHRRSELSDEARAHSELSSNNQRRGLYRQLFENTKPQIEGKGFHVIPLPRASDHGKPL